MSHIFWESRIEESELDMVSRYRFMETFNIGEFPETVAQIERWFASTFTVNDPDQIEDVELIGSGELGVSAVPLFRLWLTSRSTMLCSRISKFIDLTLTYVSTRQDSTGWYPGRIVHGKSIPDIYLTALACVVQLRLARTNWQLDRARKGVQWLAQQQFPSGAWAVPRMQLVAASESNGAEIVAQETQEPDLFTTLLAAEAIRLSGLGGYEHTLSAAESWVMTQQEATGTWDSKGFPFPFKTVLVVEYFESRRPPNSILNGYLSVARAFVLRGHEMALEDDENARRLAVVAAFQGVEAFLYACLSAPAVSMKVFEKPDQTVGMRKALTSLQTHFQSIGVLRHGQLIEYRNELDRLAYCRDQVVHKATPVGERDARELTEVSIRFCNLICQRVFGHLLF